MLWVIGYKYIYIYIYIYMHIYYIKRKRKKSILWFHYRFISGLWWPSSDVELLSIWISFGCLYSYRKNILALPVSFECIFNPKLIILSVAAGIKHSSWILLPLRFFLELYIYICVCVGVCSSAAVFHLSMFDWIIKTHFVYIILSRSFQLSWQVSWF